MEPRKKMKLKELLNTDIHFAGDLLHYDALSKWGSEWVEDKESIADLLFDIMQEVDKSAKDKIRARLDESGLLNEGGLSGELAEALKGD